MNKAVKIFITGDFYGGNRVEELILKKEYDQIFNDFLSLIRNSDVTVTNIEAPLLKSGKPIEKTGPAIKAIPETIDALKYAGFNLLTLANNHIMDYGADGLMKTMELCFENGIATVGAGENFQSASQSYYKKIDDLNIAFINIAENEWSTTTGSKPGAHPLNPVANYYKIVEAKKLADFVIVIVHGGHEMYNLPSPRMKETYRFFVDAGADAVIGHHTHCYSGYEIYKEALIFYSLGNFIFDSTMAKPESWYYGYAINLKFSKNTKPNFVILPYEQNKNNAGIQSLKEKDKETFIKELERLNAVILNDALIEKHFNEFINNELAYTYKSFIEPITFNPLRILQRLKIIPSILNKMKRRLYLNLIRCEAHRDVVIKLLNDDSDS